LSSKELPISQKATELGTIKKPDYSRFSCFAKEIASNHCPENLGLKIILPKGISKEAASLMMRNTRKLTQKEIPSQILRKFVVSEKHQQPITRREKLLQDLKNLLTDTTFLKLHLLVLDHQFKDGDRNPPQAKVQIAPVVSLHYEEIKDNFGENSSLIEYCEGTKELNLAFQEFIMSIGPKQMGLISEKTRQEFGVLIFHKHGNYLVQRVLERDHLFLDFMVASCVQKFKMFASNEYSSRVMQILIRERRDFRLFVHKYFERNIRYAVSKITVTFLLLIAMRHAEDSEEYAYVHTAMVIDPTIYEYKLFKRILISYFQFSKSTMISDTWRLLLKTQTFDTFFDKKFSSLLLLMVVRRNFEPAIRTFTSLIGQKLSSLIWRKYFKVVVAKLLQPKYKSCRAALNASLTGVSLHDLSVLEMESAAQVNFYLYASVASFEESDGAGLEAFLKKIKHLIPAELTDV
jgi:hypothetical protein